MDGSLCSSGQCSGNKADTEADNKEVFWFCKHSTQTVLSPWWANLKRPQQGQWRGGGGITRRAALSPWLRKARRQRWWQVRRSLMSYMEWCMLYGVMHVRLPWWYRSVTFISIPTLFSTQLMDLTIPNIQHRLHHFWAIIRGIHCLDVTMEAFYTPVRPVLVTHTAWMRVVDP